MGSVSRGAEATWRGGSCYLHQPTIALQEYKSSIARSPTAIRESRIMDIFFLNHLILKHRLSVLTACGAKCLTKMLEPVTYTRNHLTRLSEFIF